MDTYGIVDLVYNKNRSDALDAINDVLYAKAHSALENYKEVVAQSYFAGLGNNDEVESSPETTEEQ